MIPVATRCTLCVLVAVAAASAADDLLARARAARDAAATALRDVKREVLAARSELRSELAEARSELAALRAERDALRRRRRAASGPEEDGADAAAADLELAARLLGAPLPGPAATVDPATAREVLAATVDERLDDLAAHAGRRVARSRVFARDGTVVEVPVLRIGAAQAWAAGADENGCGLLRADGLDLPRIAGPVPDAAQRAALADLAAGGGTALPVDVSGELQRRAVPPPWSLRRWFAAGGVFMWPIVAVALLALLVIAERILVFLRLRSRPALTRRFFGMLDAGDRTAAAALVAARRTPQQRLLACGLDHIDDPAARRDGHLETGLVAEAPVFQRALGLLAACIAVAPLLGLLGTVTGMIFSFDVLAVEGTADPRALSGGIAVAMTTTQFGLMVAVPLVMAHAILSRRAQRQLDLLEEQATRFAACAGGGEDVRDG